MLQLKMIFDRKELLSLQSVGGIRSTPKRHSLSLDMCLHTFLKKVYKQIKLQSDFYK